MSSDYAFCRRVNALGRAFSLSAVNQAIGSATNLLLAIYLARALVPGEYGLYGIGFSVALLYSGLGNALLLTQMAVHYPERAESQRGAYAARMLWLVLAMCLVTLGLALLAFIATVAFGLDVEASRFWFAVAGASVSYLLKDFFVRLAYSQRRESSAIVVNSFVAFGVLSGALGSVLFQYRLSATSALTIFAFSNLLGALAGAVRAGLPYFKCEFQRAPEDVRQAWGGGRWALGGALVIWLQSQAYVYVTAITIGVAGVGYANAARLFVSPFQSLLPAVAQVMLPRMASMRALGGASLMPVAKRYLLGMMTLVAVYLATLAIVYRFLPSAALGPHYQSLGGLVALWGLALVAQVSRDSASTTMQALRMFREILIRNIWSTLVAVIMALLLSIRFGAAGAILSIALGELVLAGLLWRCLGDSNRQSRAACEGAANA